MSGQGGTPERLVAVDEKKGELRMGRSSFRVGERCCSRSQPVAEWNEAQIVVQSWTAVNERLS